MPASSAGGGGESPRGREAPRRHAAATVSFDNSIAQNCRSAIGQIQVLAGRGRMKARLVI